MLYFGIYFLIGVIMWAIALISHPEELKEVTSTSKKPPVILLGLTFIAMGLLWLPVAINLLLKKKGG
ncbi:hypothetical protein [Bacillus wiedmannii]|uniref:hypothetical protein n=1 Tax=Bacillus wiedmannii TaxID=1890302 RepID=UPI000CD8810C|nr:hypothetical protein [Bacillus wiedmannii]MBG9832137.1 hypothetical protein [Bacillus wiedmannii]UOB95748.1 hypothetical protein BTI679_30910 [Bacillus wiedmannii]